MQQRISLAALGVAGAAGGVAALGSWEDVKFQSYSFFGKALQFLDPETAHMLGVWAAANGCMPVERRKPYPELQTSLWGKRLSNPVGQYHYSLFYDGGSILHSIELY